jgi:hypothetical protein
MSLGPKSVFAAVALACIATPMAPLLAQSSPLEGSWDLTMTTPIGERKSTMTITSAGETFTVSFAMPSGAEPAQDTVADIRIEGGHFAFKRTVGIDQGQIELNYAGTVEGNALTGKVRSQFGEFELKGNRAAGGE